MSNVQIVSEILVSGSPVVTTGKRAGQSDLQCAAEHVSQVQGSQSSTSPTVTSPTLTHTVVWTTSTGDRVTSRVETDGDQSDLDSMVAALKNQIAAQGGTVLSG